MEYSKETIRSAKEVCKEVFERSAKERDAYRMASKMGNCPKLAKEVYRNMMASK